MPSAGKFQHRTLPLSRFQHPGLWRLPRLAVIPEQDLIMLKNQLKDTSLLVDRAYVDGQWISADDGATLTINNPATGEALAQVPALQGVETLRAIEAADRA
ncbi:Succinic semialdehyde dehydrogenase, partial [Pseudomonas coronafaciens pv. striafaciens]